MSIQRDPDAILAAWLEDGPARLPDSTRRAIAVSTRTTRQSRRSMWVPWRFPTMNVASRLALAAVAVVAVAVGGLYLANPNPKATVAGPPLPTPSPSPSPTASPAPSGPARVEPPVGAMTQPFTSPTFGYSIRYPAGWTATPTNGDGPSPGGADEFDSAARGWYLRVLSRAVPDGVVVDTWIRQTLTQSDHAACMPPRKTQESVTVDGNEGRIVGFCGVPPAPQIEATVVVDKRAYLFTLFDGRELPNEGEARALFDRFMTTVTLDPASAAGSPKPSPS